MSLFIPAGYHNLLGSTENTEKAIKAVKDMFQENLSAQLVLLRVTAPMIVPSGRLFSVFCRILLSCPQTGQIILFMP